MLCNDVKNGTTSETDIEIIREMDDLAELVTVLRTFTPEQMKRFLSEAQQIVDHWPDRVFPCKSE